MLTDPRPREMELWPLWKPPFLSACLCPRPPELQRPLRLPSLPAYSGEPALTVTELLAGFRYKMFQNLNEDGKKVCDANWGTCLSVSSIRGEMVWKTWLKTKMERMLGLRINVLKLACEHGLRRTWEIKGLQIERKVRVWTHCPPLDSRGSF